MQIKKVIAIFILLGVAIVGGTFIYFSGKEYIFRFSESQLQEKLNARLPVTKSHLLIFRVTLSNPRVHLEDSSKRIMAGLDVTLNIRVANEAKSLGGTIDASGEIEYVAERGEFFLVNPIIEHLEIQGIPDAYVKNANVVVMKALAEYYADHPIYSLHATDAKHMAARLVLKNVTVENRELVVTLGI